MDGRSRLVPEAPEAVTTGATFLSAAVCGPGSPVRPARVRGTSVGARRVVLGARRLVVGIAVAAVGVLVLLPVGASAAEVDTTPPVLRSVSLVGFLRGTRTDIPVVLDVSDDVGVVRGVVFVSQVSSGTFRSVRFEGSPEGLAFHVDSTWGDSTYRLARVHLYDAVGNSVVYDRLGHYSSKPDSGVRTHDVPFDETGFVVSGGVDVTPRCWSPLSSSRRLRRGPGRSSRCVGPWPTPAPTWHISTLDGRTRRPASTRSASSKRTHQRTVRSWRACPLVGRGSLGGQGGRLERGLRDLRPKRSPALRRVRRGRNTHLRLRRVGHGGRPRCSRRHGPGEARAARARPGNAGATGVVTGYRVTARPSGVTISGQVREDAVDRIEIPDLPNGVRQDLSLVLLSPWGDSPPATAVGRRICRAT